MTRTFIYTVVIPACTILAYKRIPIDNLVLNGVFWGMPYSLGVYLIVGKTASGWVLALEMALLLVMFAILVYVGDRVETWLVKRKQG